MRAHRSRVITVATLLLVIATLAGVLTALLHRTGAPDDPGRPAPKGAAQIDLAREVAGYTSRFGPGRGYAQPGQADRDGIAAAIGLLLDGHREQAEQRLAQRDFSVRTVVDRPSGHRYAEVADRTDTAVTPRGWGRVYVDLDHRPRWSVQVPHPGFDLGTEQLGVRVLRGSPGGILVIAGAHRKAGVGNSADVAHRRDSVFHAICAELARRGMPGIQLHGFAASAAPDYDVITSTGAGTAARPEGRELADALRGHGFRVCRAWVRSCPLEGRTNVQGQVADADHVPFLHVEFSPTIRAGGRPAERAADAVAEITRRWAGQPVTD
ncbi:hypothetical protein [Streptomyces roseochromogenus]|uniref:Uncharacterized protein n=1 Tax=Streptomyces roseochromogenus subsp. oscitans DS 12.976 TaxID=1352936 RepID=V6KSV6_STRRC|nr:hypothetical protein [Streptomyces roseochromogenus]EST34501.1 hypothetical protein M878_09910 [Streptomyces roseochromogenus subsp. oscitans DS 12.976]